MPWQTNSTFIIVLFLLDLSRNALFCKGLWGYGVMVKCSEITDCGKTEQNWACCYYLLVVKLVVKGKCLLLRVFILFSKTHFCKLLYPPVQSFNPFAERTRNPLEFIMSKSMGWFLHSWNEKYAYFFCFVFLKISVHIVIPRLKGNKPYSIFCGINFHALFHVICKIYKFLGIFPIVIFYCFSLIFSV